MLQNNLWDMSVWLDKRYISQIFVCFNIFLFLYLFSVWYVCVVWCLRLCDLYLGQFLVWSCVWWDWVKSESECMDMVRVSVSDAVCNGLNLITGANNFNTNSSATLKRALASITDDLAILLGKCINKRSHNSASIFLYIPVMFRYMLFQWIRIRCIFSLKTALVSTDIAL